MDEIITEDLDDEIDEEEQEEIVLATVTAVSANGLRIKLDGEEEAGEKYYKANAGQRYAVNDRVKVEKNSGTYIVEYVVGNPGARFPIPSGGSDGQVLTKNGATNYAVKWASLPTVHSVPAGGSQNQVLAKKSSSDYDVKWSDLPQGIPSGGTQGQVLTKNSGTNYDVKWVSLEDTHGIPSGGTTGQYLKKSSNTNYAVEWGSAPATDRLTSSAKHVIYNGSALYADYSSSLGMNNYYWSGCYISGAMRFGNGPYGNSIGFFGTTPISKITTITTSSTLSALIQALKNYGLL